MSRNFLFLSVVGKSARLLTDSIITTRGVTLRGSVCYTLLFAFILTACGGGGGSSSPTIVDARHQSHSVAEDTLAALAAGEMQAGTVSTRFEAPQWQRFRPPVEGDPQVSLTVEHTGGKFTLGSRQHTITEPQDQSYHQAPLVLTYPPPAQTYDYPYSHSSQDWTLFDTEEESTRTAYVHISWNNYDPTDYLAAGYWMDIEGSLHDRQIPSEVHAGAFVDGPEFDASGPAQLPISGTATYLGHSAGMYTYYYGAGSVRFDRPDLVGARETAVWAGNVQLLADFDTMKISGCIGCTVSGQPESEIIWESDGHLELADGFRTVNSATYHNRDGVHFTRIYLQEADIQSPGQRMHGDVTVENDYDLFVGGDGGSSYGSWEGRYSGLPDGDGAPRLVGGTFTGAWVGSDGQNNEPGGPTHGEFLGYFFAGPEGNARGNFPRPTQ